MKQLMFHSPKSETICVQQDNHWFCFKGNLGGTAERQAKCTWAFTRVVMPSSAETEINFWASTRLEHVWHLRTSKWGSGDWTAGCSQKSVGQWHKGIGLSVKFSVCWRWERSWQCPVLRLKMTCLVLFTWWILSSLAHMLKHCCHIVLKLFLRMAFASLQDTVGVGCSCLLPLLTASLLLYCLLHHSRKESTLRSVMFSYIINPCTSFCYFMSLSTEQVHKFWLPRMKLTEGQGNSKRHSCLSSYQVWKKFAHKHPNTNQYISVINFAWA